MTTSVIDNKIEMLKGLKRKMLDGTLTSTELKDIYDCVYTCHHVSRCDSNQGFTHFYVDKEDRASLVKELELYEGCIAMHRTNFASTTPVFNPNGKYGAGFIDNKDGKYIHVYDPMYDDCICADGNYIHLIDERKLDYESIVTRSGDVYRISHGSRYLDGFRMRSENAADKNNSIMLDVLYYGQRPVYICDFSLGSKDAVDYFFDSREILYNEDFATTVSKFDDAFMSGSYGPQKTFK